MGNCTRILKAYAGSAFIVKQHYYDTLIATWEEGLHNLMHTHQHFLYASDVYWHKLQEKDLWYGTRLGKQRDGFSDNRQGYVEYEC